MQIHIVAGAKAALYFPLDCIVGWLSKTRRGRDRVVQQKPLSQKCFVTKQSKTVESFFRRRALVLLTLQFLYILGRDSDYFYVNVKYFTIIPLPRFSVMKTYTHQILQGLRPGGVSTGPDLAI